MSIAVQNFTDHFTDNFVPHTENGHTSQPVVRKRKKVQTPYKPRLSTLVKRAMEDCVDDAVETQMIMEQMLGWLEEETKTREALRERISLLAPLDHRMATLLAEETETLLRIGKLELYLARMALSVTRLERRLRHSLECAKDSLPPQNKARKETESGRRQ